MSRLDDPRILFAAERTLLAWLRRSIVRMGFGFAVERPMAPRAKQVLRRAVALT